MDAESARWIQALTASSPEREAAMADLYAMLLRAAHVEAARRSGHNGVTGVELDDIADQAASDATLSVLRRIDAFRGESRFTTWAYKFVIFEVSSKLTRHVWRRERSHTDPAAWERLPDVLGVGPEASAEARVVMRAVRQGVEEALTEHQRRIFIAIVVDATPLDALVADLQSNRNAVYKTMFDARRKLRAYLSERGFLEPVGATPRPTTRQSARVLYGSAATSAMTVSPRDAATTLKSSSADDETGAQS